MDIQKFLQELVDLVNDHPTAKLITEEIGSTVVGLEYDPQTDEIIIQTDRFDEED